MDYYDNLLLLSFRKGWSTEPYAEGDEAVREFNQLSPWLPLKYLRVISLSKEPS